MTFRTADLFTFKNKTMARQKGIIKLEGTIGDITFHNSKNGYIAKAKGGVSANRIASDPAFVRTRENGAEFGRAGKAGKLLRMAFRPQIQKASDSRIIGRLMREMMRVIKADTTSVRGLRNVIDGETELLQGFEFNESAKLGATLYAPYTTLINRATGLMAVNFNDFDAFTMLAAPSGTTHFQFMLAGADIDFNGETYTALSEESAVIPWDSAGVPGFDLSVQLGPNSAHPLFLCLGVVFLQDVNGTKYPLQNGSFNTLGIVKVSGL
jgi:hypothetical protein